MNQSQDLHKINKPKRIQSIYIAFLKLPIYGDMTGKEKRALWKQYKELLDIDHEFALDLEADLIEAVDLDKIRFQNEMEIFEAHQLSLVPEIVIVPEIECSIPISQDVLCTILRSQKLRGRDIVQALVCKHFRDALRESASEWIHPMFYLQSSVQTIKWKCIPKCSCKMISVEAREAMMMEAVGCVDIFCGYCRHTEFSNFIQHGEESRDYLGYLQNNNLRRNPNVLYGYGHRAGKNPYFNDMDPVEGGNYKLPKRLPKSVRLYLK